MATESVTRGLPKAFISYSWDDGPHKRWAKDLATRLRKDGVDVTLDRWAMAPGDQLPHFMETAVRENDFVLIVCTRRYKERSEGRRGGVGYEGDVMTGEVSVTGNHRKFIPVLRSGSRRDSVPSWLLGKYAVSLAGDPYPEEEYRDLLTTLHNQREQAPPLGGPPERAGTLGNVDVRSPRQANERGDFTPVRILGVVVDEVGEPRNDGTRGSVLYRVPFKLSRRPSREWARLFVQAWDHPPRWTLRHRPGIAEVSGDRVILARTTLEEVQEVHRDTLKVVIDDVNRKAAEHFRRQNGAEEAKERERRDHDEKVRRIARGISFD